MVEKRNSLCEFIAQMDNFVVGQAVNNQHKLQRAFVQHKRKHTEISNKIFIGTRSNFSLVSWHSFRSSTASESWKITTMSMKIVRILWVAVLWYFCGPRRQHLVLFCTVNEHKNIRRRRRRFMKFSCCQSAWSKKNLTMRAAQRRDDWMFFGQCWGWALWVATGNSVRMEQRRWRWWKWKCGRESQVKSIIWLINPMP